MFAKVFGQIFDSSIAEDYTVRHMFIDLLILADSDGAVDMTHEAISRRTNVPIETVKRCMDELGQPDPASRSPIHEGKRIVPLDSHRGWGWQIVNYRHYRQIRDEEVRRSYFRDQKRKQRKKERRTSSVQDKMVDNGGHCQTVASASSSSSASASAEKIYDAYPRKIKRPAALAAIKKALIRHEAAYLLERTKAYALTQPKNYRFTPHPSTWFNQQQFADDPETWSPVEGAPRKERKFREPAKPKPEEIDIPDKFKTWALERYEERRDEIAGWKVWADAPGAMRKEWWAEEKAKMMAKIGGPYGS